MPDLPPAAEVLETLKKAVAPSAGGAALVFVIGLLLSWVVSKAVRFDWRVLAGPFAVVALAAAMAAGNHFRDVFPFRALPEHDAKWWHWIWPAAGTVLLAELLARLPWVNPGVGHLIRLGGFAVGPCYLIPQAWAPDGQWCVWWVPALIGMWALLTEVGEWAPGGALPAAVAVAALGAAAVLLHNLTHGLADAATFVGCALAAVALLCFLTQTDGTSAASAGAVAVALLLLLSQSTSPKPLPKAVLVLAAFAPLALGAFLLPGFRRINDVRYATPAKLGLVAIPVTAAVVWAMKVAPLSFGEKEAW